jgi:catechol 2,3-dioxygenase-like lactoylglutathione lyase family enzyme
MRLHHLALRTGDVERTLVFYREMFSLEIVRDARPKSVWLGLGDGSVIMIEARGDAEPPVPAGSFELAAFRVDPAEKSRIREASRARGCFDGETEHTVYFRDPDGRRLGVSTHPLLAD